MVKERKIRPIGPEDVEQYLEVYMRIVKQNEYLAVLVFFTGGGHGTRRRKEMYKR